MAFLLIPWFEAHNILPGVNPHSNAWEIPIFGTTLPIQPFGLLVATGVLLGARIAEEFGKKQGLHPRVVSDYATHVIFGGFIGAFFLNALFYEPSNFFAFFTGLGKLLLSIPGALFQGKGYDSEGIRYLGLSSYGGFIGFVVGLIVWQRKRGWSALPPADAGAFGFPLGWMFGRTGCFITHDHPGQATDFFLAVDKYRGGDVARHDLGLYEVIWSAATFGLFLYLAQEKRKTGFYLALLCVLYAPVRFCLDFLRAPPVQGGDVRYLGLTPAQYGSIAALVIGIALFRYINSREEPVLSKLERWPETEPETDKAPKKSSAGRPGAARKARKARH